MISQVRIRRLGMLGVIMLSAAFFAYLQGDFGFGASDVFGTIISKDEAAIRGATVENVVLYPKKMEHSRERIMRKAVLVRPEGATATVLISHGYMCTKEDIAFLRSLFPNHNSMIFDMRAHGENTEGQYCTFGRDEAFDVMAAAQFLRNHPELKEKPLFVYGFSMGAVAAIEAQAKDKSLFDGMILDCPFDTTENIVKMGLDNLKFSLFGYEFTVPGRSFLQKYMFHPYVQSFVKTMLKTVAKMDTKTIRSFMYPLYPAESVKKISVPLFIIHCKNDKKVTVSAVKRVYKNAASSYKKLWITNGRRHFDSFFYNPESYRRRVAKFAQKLVTGQLDEKKKHKIIQDGEQKTVSVHLHVGHDVVKEQ